MLRSQIAEDPDLRVEEKIHKLAVAIAYQYGRDDNIALAQDLEIAGWIGYLADKRPEEKLRLMKAQDFMKDAWVSWRFHTPGRARKRGVLDVIQVDGIGERFVDNCPSVEESIVAADLLEKLVAVLTRTHKKENRALLLLQAMLEEGVPRFGNHVQTKVPAMNAHYHKQKIQSEFRKLLAA